MHVHFLQHVPFEKPGVLLDWFKKNHYSVSHTLFFENEECPHPNDFDALVIMGGPMSIHDEKKYPWLKAEKSLVRFSIEQKKMVIGICLGAQLIADALGGRVFKNTVEEIGWFPIELTKEGQCNPLFKDLPQRFPVLHWHGEAFDLPSGAVHVFQSMGCSNQAFVYDDHVLALQFHMEAKNENVQEMIQHLPKDISLKRFVQHPDEIIMDTPDYMSLAHAVLMEILDRFILQNKKSKIAKLT